MSLLLTFQLLPENKAKRERENINPTLCSRAGKSVHMGIYYVQVLYGGVEDPHGNKKSGSQRIKEFREDGGRC